MLTWLDITAKGAGTTDYYALATDFMRELHKLSRSKPQKNIQGAMQGEAFVLQYLAMNKGGGVIPSDISSEMNISSARIAATLNNLESKGLITRRIDSGDRRRIIVELTPQGGEQAQSHKQSILGLLSRMFANLGESDASEYVRITGRLAELACDLNEAENHK